ncbi:hypothetical protein Taro_050323 [Colocasia esculenta]|uniref:Retrotransposon gag domain-containing protein n=1 Tax=Colocasia esculenta TaxID=4460 RepID=A0A843XDK5_COLES|nr:hypothetical protein [Colocasia esculenta]
MVYLNVALRMALLSSASASSGKVRARRTFHDRRPVQSRAVAVQGRYLQLCSSSSSSIILWFGIPCEASARSLEADSDQVRYRFNGLGRGVPPQLVSEQEISGMADRRDWGGGGDDPEESTQCMIERIWESLTDIRARMDQQAPVPPVAVPPGDGETVHVAPVPPRVEVPFAAPVPPPPVLLAEELVMQVEKFLRLQPPTYSRGLNPDTAEHWVHEIERVFTTMRCPAADKVVLAAYQLRGFALEWWRLKMHTTFASRTYEAITWSEFLDVFNDTFFPIQVQQVKREQFQTLQQVVPRGMPQALEALVKCPEVYWKGKEQVRQGREDPPMGLEAEAGHPSSGCLELN